MKPHRRQVLAMALPVLWVCRPAGAAVRRYVALSLLADRFEIVFARAGTGSRLDRNQRQAFDAGASIFDRFALRAVQAAVQRIEPVALFTMLALPTTSRLYDEPDRIFDGRSVALPGSVVDALDAAKATHLILLTKVRGEVRIPIVEGTTGVGTVRGVGFYIDPDLRLKRTDSLETASGVLAPFAYLQLTLVDAESGQILREELIRAMRAFTVAGQTRVVDPWQLLSAEEKVDALQRLLEDELARAVPALIA